MLCPRQQDEICAIIAAGCSRQVAAQYVGCHVRTILRAMRRDPGFAARVQQAETMYEVLHMKHIAAAASEAKNWRAAAWALERKFPERYGKRHPASFTLDQVSLLLTQIADILVEEVSLPEDRRRILQRLRAIKLAAAKGAKRKRSSSGPPSAPPNIEQQPSSPAPEIHAD